MKRLIVNADDLGASPGITRGILEAHERGIVTSTSLMVETPWSEEAAALTRATPRLSVGLHVVLPEGDAGPNGDGALERQVARFAALMGRMPTHIDSHHNVHHDPRHLPAFLALAHVMGLPLRGHSPVRHFSGFYGRWGGESHPEHVSLANLGRMLAREVGEGFTEFGCHPGYHDPRVPSDYAAEREVELATLCDPRLRGTLETLGITLAGFDEIGRLAPAGGVR